MKQRLLVIWLLWLSSSVAEIHARVKNNRTDSHIVIVEENDVPKLLVSSSGDGDKSKTSSKNQGKNAKSTDEEEERKTLAQQVADGKYGLIQTELFSKPAKRPGIISYDVNPEVPKDNINNLGGLQADEIWLAENHLLVLKGGGFRDKGAENVTWKPIDSYVAPKRQVKIPPKPKVAPPFPVQLKDGGPVEFIQGEKNTFGQLGPPAFHPPTNVKNNITAPPPGFPYPFPPFGLPPPPPYPIPGNISDIDEDDPRFYYPPPYDFIYDKDNSSHVAPGPLVPGIVLPPPADFFAPLTSTTKRPAQKLEKRPPERDKSQKHNQIVNTFVPKRVTLTKPAASNPSTGGISENKQKAKAAVQDLPERKEKEDRKHAISNRPVDVTPHSIIGPPESTTNVSRVVTRPTERTTVSPRVYTTTKVPKLKAPKTTSNGWVPIVGAPICPPNEPHCYDITPVKYDNRLNHISLLLNSTDKAIEYIPEIPNANSVTRNNEYYSINNDPRQHFYTTTPNPYYDLKSIIVPTSVTTASYKSVDNDYNPRETYYVYEDPIVPGAKVILKDYVAPDIRNGPTIVYVNHDVRPKYELNTGSPLHVLTDQAVKKPRHKVKNKPSPLELFENELSTITNSNKFSISYSSGDSQHNVHQISGYSYPSPLDEALDNIIKNSHQNNYKNKKGRSKEVKTPVFEYSFSAPGYGENDSPKISSVIPSTKKPDSALHPSQFSFFGFDSRPGSDSNLYHERNTEAPITYTPKTKYRKVILDQLDFLATEVPYTQVYTPQEPELLDDITKNYFTLFGKKINPDTYSKYVTTPIPPQADSNGNVYFDRAKTRQRTPKGPKRQNIRFPEETTVSVKNVNNNNEDQRPPDVVGNQAPRPSLSKLNNYNNRYYNNYRPKYYHRDYSLASDVNVNYKKPYPPINPDAEFINPAYLPEDTPSGNSYISYQLPGNGGHFYFLTPQSIQATNYHLASSGVRLPSPYNRLYYKRNAQTPRNRRWTKK